MAAATIPFALRNLGKLAFFLSQAPTNSNRHNKRTAVESGKARALVGDSPFRFSF
jgi:hypothetical protein